jgi:hypothetical protein
VLIPRDPADAASTLAGPSRSLLRSPSRETLSADSPEAVIAAIEHAEQAKRKEPTEVSSSPATSWSSRNVGPGTLDGDRRPRGRGLLRIDNPPTALVPGFVELCASAKNRMEKVARPRSS